MKYYCVFLVKKSNSLIILGLFFLVGLSYDLKTIENDNMGKGISLVKFGTRILNKVYI